MLATHNPIIHVDATQEKHIQAEYWRPNVVNQQQGVSTLHDSVQSNGSHHTSSLADSVSHSSNNGVTQAMDEQKVQHRSSVTAAQSSQQQQHQRVADQLWSDVEADEQERKRRLELLGDLTLSDSMSNSEATSVC